MASATERAKGAMKPVALVRIGPFRVAWLGVVTWMLACGGRTPLRAGENGQGGSSGSGGAPSTPCVFDEECGSGTACSMPTCVGGVCRESQVSCDDSNPCTEDTCDPALGCTYRSLVRDADGDGYASPRPGFLPGMPGACGDDCDDQSALAFPGNPEVCDGFDNDCNGVIDDGAVYVPRSEAVRISSPSDVRSSLAGLASTPDGFVFSYSARRGTRSQNILTVLGRDLRPLSETSITNVNADTFAGPLVSAGSALATVWEDARQDTNYEIYFARFDQAARKLGPDLRVTDAPQFSLNPKIVWNQSEYLLVWDDRRAEQPGASRQDLARVYAQRVTADGMLLGQNRLLTPEDPIAEFPDVAIGPGRIGLVFVSSDGLPRLVFRVLDESLTPIGERPPPLGEDVQGPSVHLVAGRFVVLFNTYHQAPGDALMGAAFDTEGRLVVSPRRLTEGARFARTHHALTLGDRLLVVWADDLDGNYELYSQVLSPDLTVIRGRERLTHDAADTLGPLISRGPEGQIGVAFSDYRLGSRQTYMLTLGCP